ALAAAARVPGLVATFLSTMSQEHERGLGSWSVEFATLAAAVQATGAAAASLADAIESLRVDGDRMWANLSATRGSVLAERATLLLAPSLGRDAAAKIVADALASSERGDGTFAEALMNDPAAGSLASADAPRFGAPDDYLGSAEHFRRALLAEPTE